MQLPVRTNKVNKIGSKEGNKLDSFYKLNLSSNRKNKESTKMDRQ